MPLSEVLPKEAVEIGAFLVALIVIHIVNFASGMRFTKFGVVPRTIDGVRGILFSPLLHTNFGHLFANTAPLGVMLGLLAFSRGVSLWVITGAIWIASGLIVWVIGRPRSVQVGASGVIYGLAAFLLATAWLQRDLKAAAAALIVIVLYGGIVWGLLPTRKGVSWEGHLAGALAGLLVAISETQLLGIFSGS